jgi:hypothetical protein
VLLRSIGMTGVTSSYQRDREQIAPFLPTLIENHSHLHPSLTLLWPGVSASLAGTQQLNNPVIARVLTFTDPVQSCPTLSNRSKPVQINCFRGRPWGVIAETLVDIRLHKIMSFFKGTPPLSAPLAPFIRIGRGNVPGSSQTHLRKAYRGR